MLILIKMRSAIYWLLAGLLVASVSADDNYEARFSDQFLTEEFEPNNQVPSDAEVLNENQDLFTPETSQFYAGPLRPTEIDEVIVVSRDNVQQIIKTIMLAYTHSKDPTMMQLFQTGGLGALKTTFKYLGKEDLGDAILSTAQAYIKELNLEKEEEQVLGEFAERFLEHHKFKIVVPESFLLHEKEILEFLDKKEKLKKKGRSMPGFEDEQELELHSVLPYTGRQFQTSIIPGLDLTWLALLGGMLAIPYYFLSDDNSAPTARKDEVKAPLPSLTPPAFEPSFNEINVPKHPKRQRKRPNGQRRHPKLPPGVDLKNIQDKNQLLWYNNHFLQQHPHGILPIANQNSKITVLPAIHAMPPHGHQGPLLHQTLPGPVPFGQPHGPTGSNILGMVPPQPAQLQHHLQHHQLNKEQLNQHQLNQQIGQQPHFNQHHPLHQHQQQHVAQPKVSYTITERLIAPSEEPESPKHFRSSENINGEESFVIPPSNDQELEESILRPQVHLPPTEQASKSSEGVSTERKQEEHFGHHPPKPNSILQVDPKEFEKEKQQDLLPQLPPPPPPPPSPQAIPQIPQRHFQSFQTTAVLHPGSNQIIRTAPFIPTHFENGSAITQSVLQGLPPLSSFQQRPNLHRLPQIPVQRPLIQGAHLAGQRPHIQGHGIQIPQIPGQNPVRPQFFGHPRPGFQTFVPQANNAPVPGFRGVPQGIDQSRLSSPLLPPPPPIEQLGSGEQRDTFGSIRPPREGNSHFKVSHSDKLYRENLKKVNEEKETDGPQTPKSNINLPPTIIYAEPQSNSQEADQDLQSSVKVQHIVSKPTIRHIFITKDQRQQTNNNNDVQQKTKFETQFQERPVQRIPHEQPESQSQFYNDERDGFIPIYGPPKTPHGILDSQLSKMPKVPNPRDFLDKLIAENKENTKSNVHITFGEPFSVADETGRYPPQIPAVETQTAAPSTRTTPGSSVFVHVPTEPEDMLESGSNPSFRVVTSKSVVTSRPVPLDEKFTFNFGEKINKHELKLKQKYSQEEDVITQKTIKDWPSSERLHFNDQPQDEEFITSPSIVQPNEHDYSYDESDYGVDYSQSAGEQENTASFPNEQNEKSSAVITQLQPVKSYIEVPDQSATEPEVDNNIDRILRMASGEIPVAGETNELPQEDENKKEKRDSVPVYSLDPFYGPRLSRIDAIFFQLKLDSEGCRQQAVCNMYKNPDGYAPLSDFLSRQLTVTLEELKRPQLKDERILRFFRYLHAATIGQDGGDCLYEYPECSHDTTRLYNKPTLDYYHKVSDLIDRSSFQA